MYSNIAFGAGLYEHRCRSRLVACCWACHIGRLSVYLFLFHSDDRRFDGSGGYTGVGRGGNAVAESRLSASHDRVGSLAGIIESIRTLLSAARIEANISPRRLPIAELIARWSQVPISPVSQELACGSGTALPITLDSLRSGGYAALQFLEPVEHNVDLSGRRLLNGSRLDHQKALAVGCNVVVGVHRRIGLV